MGIHSKCFICGNLTSNRKLRTPTLHEAEAQILQDWKRSWARSLCEILGLEQESYTYVFATASYCCYCQESICNVEFTLKAIKRFQFTVCTLRSDIMDRLQNQYAALVPGEEDQDPLALTDTNTLENVIRTIQSIKPESDSDFEGGGDDEFNETEHEDQYILPTIPEDSVEVSSPLPKRRLFRLKRRLQLPVVNVKISSEPTLSSAKNENEPHGISGSGAATSSVKGVNDVNCQILPAPLPPHSRMGRCNKCKTGSRTRCSRCHRFLCLQHRQTTVRCSKENESDGSCQSSTSPQIFKTGQTGRCHKCRTGSRTRCSRCHRFLCFTHQDKTVRCSANFKEDGCSSPNKISSRSGRIIKRAKRLQKSSDDDDEDSALESDQVHETENEDESLPTDYAEGNRSPNKNRRKRKLGSKSPKKAMERHDSDKDDEEEFRCPVCQKTFLSVRRMKAHERTHRHRLKESASFKCYVCYKLFPSTRARDEHVPLHQPDTAFTCVLCSKTLTSLPELIHHVQLEHDRRVVWCNFPECLQTHVAFTHQAEMKTHLEIRHRLEGKELEYTQHCTHCPRRFKDKVPLQNHLVLAHQILEGKALSCQYCCRVFIGKQRLKLHQENMHSEIQRNPKCSICSKSFPTIEKAAEHELLHNSSHRNIFDCVLCEEKLFSTCELQRHVLKSHEEFPFQCWEVGCDGLGFEFERKLKEHQDSVHYPIKKAKCCDKCPFKTRKLDRLKSHMLTHEGEKKFACRFENCRARFYQQRNLDAHLRGCHNPNLKSKFPCKLCPKTFPRRTQLSSHETYHSDLRPFLCEVCSATFKTTNTLSHHMRVHDPTKKTGNNWKLQRPRKPRLSFMPRNDTAAVQETPAVPPEASKSVDGNTEMVETQDSTSTRRSSGIDENDGDRHHPRREPISAQTITHRLVLEFACLSLVFSLICSNPNCK